jgi:FtsX-like permease family
VSGGRGAVGALARHDLRQRWRTVVAVGILFGLAAGIGLACIAGARRTDTLFARHLDASHAADVEIDPGNLDPDSDRALRSIPEVEQASAWTAMGAYPLTPDGEPDPDGFSLLSFTSDGRYLDMDRVATIEGRRLDPTAPDEVMVNEVAAAVLGLDVGSTFPLGLFELDENGFPASFEPDRTATVTVVGIMALNEDVVTEAEEQIPRLFVSPAFEPPTPDSVASYFNFAWYGLRLEGGREDAEAVVQQWDQLAAAHNAELAPDDPGWLTFAHRASDLERKADRAVRPLVVAVATFGLLATLAAVVLAGQSLARGVRLAADDLRAARVLGLRPRQAVAVALAVPAASVTAATVVAVVTALALSTAFPAGPHVDLEPNPGLSVDATVLLPGLALLVLLPVVAALVAARREAAAGVLHRADQDHRRSRLVSAVARSGAPSPAVASLRLTVEPGQGRSFVPTRSVLVSNAVVVVALVTTIVFAQNVDALGADPERYGFTGDGLMATDGGYGQFEPETVADWLATRTEVDGWRLGAADRTVVAGRATAGVAFGQAAGTGDALHPVLISGRAPDAGEIVLGESTLAAIGADIGSTVPVGAGDAERDLTVVGTAVFPVLGPLLADKTGLDRGAWVAAEDVDVFERLAFGPSPWNVVLLDLESEDGVAALNAVVDDAPVTPEDSDSDVVGVIEPAEVQTTTDAGGYRPAVIGVLGVVALTSTLLTLLAVVRRRRIDLAVYRVLGFRPRQLRASVALQGIWFGVAALVVGVPVGLVLGTQLWRWFADSLGVVPDPTVEWAPIAVAGAAVLGVGLLSAVAPAIAVGRQRQRPPDPA